jgi:anaerobic magnesium-protoporphyrin IX monomethyl ester cyclase
MRVLFPIQDVDTQYTGAMTISAVLKAEGHEVIGIEAKAQTVLSYLEDDQPTLIAFSVPTSLVITYLDLIKEIKKQKPDIFCLMGGWHPTYSPDLINEEGVDAVCIGEGELAMKELCAQMDDGRFPSNICNLWIKHKDGSIEKNERAPLIQDLDSLPLPDRKFMISGQPEYYYIIASVVTQRSCPYSCSFCVNNAFNRLYKGENPHKRRRSVDHVIAELLEIKSHGKLEFVKFEDSIFTLHPEWINEFADKYSEKIGVPFTCFVRAETVNEKMIADIKRAGCVSVAIGVEVGNEKIRSEVFNKKITDQKLKQAFQVIKNAGLKIRAHNIIGIPEYGIDVDLATLQLNADLQPDYAACGFLQPYPGTEVYERYLAQGLISKDLRTYLASIPQSYIEPALPLKNVKNVRQARNLLRLFAFAVNFPWTIPMIKKMINLPLTDFYRIIYGGWKSYAYFFKIWPVSMKQLWILIKRFGRLTT